ncbi:MAG TPA: UDP-2,3-diacylglucosamine diphosphatase [Candidatus Krumholzibacterium sp.]|nr:UDP-2,3-diacylglucosamine diphosphatase [Candidatus Krumholzibacterium sp.]
MNGTVLFISDTHFKYKVNEDAERRKRKLFVDFLESVTGVERLYLVGDIFDFWFEYGNVVPGHYSDVLCALGRLRGSGTRIMMMGGNHDHWLGSALTDDYGIEILASEVTHDLQGRKITITHGDSVMPGDRGYKLLKAIIRSRPVISLARLLHPDLLFSFAHWFSKCSKGVTESRTSRYARQLASIAESSFFGGGNDTFVMGHVHLPLLERYGDRTFVILGDWETHFSYLRLSGGELSLERYHSDG